MYSLLRCVAAVCLFSTLITPHHAHAWGEPAHSVHGHGRWGDLAGLPDGGNHFDQISIHAWHDEDGLAQGIVEWAYETNPLPGGGGQTISGYPWTVAVDTLIMLDSNYAWIEGIVINSGQSPEDIGARVVLFVMDNGNGNASPPDELAFWSPDYGFYPIDSGNFRVR